MNECDVDELRRAAIAQFVEYATQEQDWKKVVDDHYAFESGKYVIRAGHYHFEVRANGVPIIWEDGKNRRSGWTAEAMHLLHAAYEKHKRCDDLMRALS